jgi:branched-chain amino acid transport system substrate-binding protein
MKAKNVFLALAGLAVAAALVVFILPKKEADIVKIGVFLPMTGGVASYGQMGWAGIKTANKLEPTVLGKKVELILVDEKSDKIEAANAVSRLTRKKKSSHSSARLRAGTRWPVLR